MINQVYMFIFSTLQEVSKRCLSMLSSKGFIVYGLTFRSSIHFEFICVYGIKNCSKFIIFHVVVQFSQHHLLKRLSFFPLHIIFLFSFVKGKVPIGVCVYHWLSILFHWSICLFWGQYHTVMMAVALQCNMKSGKLIPPAPFLFLKIALVLQGILCLHTNCEKVLFQFYLK